MLTPVAYAVTFLPKQGDTQGPKEADQLCEVASLPGEMKRATSCPASAGVEDFRSEPWQLVNFL